MLKVVKIISPYSGNKDAKRLYIENRHFLFVISAPIYWWIDAEGVKYGFDLSRFSDEEKQSIPISTSVDAILSLQYREIVDICKDYKLGAFKYEQKAYQWCNENEWSEFCETLLTIQGIKDLIEEEE